MLGPKYLVWPIPEASETRAGWELYLCSTWSPHFLWGFVMYAFVDYVYKANLCWSALSDMYSLCRMTGSSGGMRALSAKFA